VQRNESFASIAQAVYGNEAYYPHLMRANPNIDPKKLRVGMTIVIPDASEVVARDASAEPASATIPAPGLDSTREYRVQPNDSLYKIALRLYGRADKLDAIYELNKDQIGPNRSYLKAGMILKLPEPPTSTTAAR
jgi:nucleoid-associated protein YgaU